MTTTPDPAQTPQSDLPQAAQPLPQSTEAAQPVQPAQPAQPAQPVQHTQPTVQLPETMQQPSVPQQPAPQLAAQAPAAQTPGAQTPVAQAPVLQAPAAPQATPYGAPYGATPGYAPHPTHVADTLTAEVPEGVASISAAAPAAEPSTTKSRAGVFFAGIAIGAVVAGIVGGGAGALIAANQQPNAVVQSQTSGRVTLNNLDSATHVSGVALAATPSVVTLEVTGQNAAGSGSGVIYSDEGYIVTNAHVVTLDGEAGANPEIRVWLSDGRILDGTVVGTDPYADLAVVKIEADDLVPVAIADSSEINVGDLTVAIGAPLNLSNTVTSGVVSALNRGISVGSPIIPDEQGEEQDQDQSEEGSDGFPWYRFGDPNQGNGDQQQEQQPQTQSTGTQVTLPVIQTDASINPGNSGGALLNANAELIGINVAIASNGSDSSTAGSVGLGFAIPVNMVTRVADALIAGEQPSHGLLGIGVNDSSADTDEDRNVAGGLISQLTAGGAAEAAGLKVGDVITAVDGVPADSGTSVSALVRMHAGGDTVTITYSRGGKIGETEVTLGTLES